MHLILKRFSQDVDLSNPDEVKYFLVFETLEGREIRLPVQKETTEALVEKLYAQEAPVKFEEDVGHEDEVEPPDEEYEEEKTAEEEEPEAEVSADDEIGDGEGGDLEDLEPASGIYAAHPRHMKKPPTPASEDEVPSL